MHCARKRQAILHNVRSTGSHGPNVRRLHLRFSAAIHHAESCHSTSVVVGLADLAAEIGVANLSIEEDLFDPSCLLLWWRSHQIQSLGIDVARIKLQTHGVFRSQGFVEAGARDRGEVGAGENPYRFAMQICADAARISDLPQGGFCIGATGKRDRAVERYVISDQRIGIARPRRIGINSQYPSHSNVSAPTTISLWLSINDPLAY